MYVVASDGGLLAEPVELKELTLYSGERYEVLIDARDGVPFDVLTLPVDQMAMSLPPFHRELRLVTVNPDGADTAGKLPDTLVKVPQLVKGLPPVSRDLAMKMNMDDQGMGAFRKAGLMRMMESKKADPAVIEAVNKLITEEPALPLETQLSANAVDGQPFKLGTVPFSGPNSKRALIACITRCISMDASFGSLSLTARHLPPIWRGGRILRPCEKAGHASFRSVSTTPRPTNASTS